MSFDGDLFAKSPRCTEEIWLSSKYKHQILHQGPGCYNLPQPLPPSPSLLGNVPPSSLGVAELWGRAGTRPCEGFVLCD